MHFSDIELAQHCVRGKPEAWDIFINRYSEVIRQTILHILGQCNLHDSSKELSRDLTQDIFLILKENDCTRLGQYKGKNGASLKTWLKVVVSRHVFDYLNRRCKPAISLDAMAASGAAELHLIDENPLPDSEIGKDPMIHFLKQEIGRLGSKDRLLIRLIYTEDLAIKEASKIVGLSEGAIYTRISRIKTRLKERIKDQNFM